MKKKLFIINIIFIPIIFTCILAFIINGYTLTHLFLSVFFFAIYILFMYGEFANSINTSSKNLCIQSDGTNLIIEYKKERFTVPIDSYTFLDQFYKKDTGKDMNLITKESLVSHIRRNYWYYIKGIPKENVMIEQSVNNYFTNIREVNDIEKNNLLKYINFKNLILAKVPALLLFSFFLSVFGYVLYISLNDVYDHNFMSCLLIALIFFVCILYTLKNIFLIISFKKKILNNPIYITECQISVKINGFTKDTWNDIIIKNNYLGDSKSNSCEEVIIKSDRNYYLNKWFAVGLNFNNNIATLYILNYDNKNEFILVTK